MNEKADKSQSMFHKQSVNAQITNAWNKFKYVELEPAVPVGWRLGGGLDLCDSHSGMIARISGSFSCIWLHGALEHEASEETNTMLMYVLFASSNVHPHPENEHEPWCTQYVVYRAP